MLSLVKKIFVVVCLTAVGSSVGCSSVTKVYDDVVSDVTGKGAPATEGRFYVAAEALPLYAEPSFSSNQIAELTRNEAVDRDELSGGFAHVRVVGTGKKGWVDNAKLGWRAPKTAAQAEEPAPAPKAAPDPADAPAETVAEADADPQPTDLSPPTAPDDAPGAKSKDGKSVDPALFDAF